MSDPLTEALKGETKRMLAEMPESDIVGRMSMESMLEKLQAPANPTCGGQGSACNACPDLEAVMMSVRDVEMYNRGVTAGIEFERNRVAVERDALSSHWSSR